MAHVSINTFGSKFVIADSSGEPVTPTMYSSMRTARQAATKLGHTYTSDTPKAEAPAPKSKAKVSEAMQAELDAAEVLKFRDEALAAAGYSKGMDKDDLESLDWDAADAVAIKHGFKNYYSLKRVARKVRNGIWFNNQTPEKQAELKAKSETRKAKKVERKAKAAKPKAKTAKAPVIKDDLSEAERQLRNAVCRANGFPRFRELQHAASHPEHPRHTDALTVMGIVASTLTATANRAQLEKPFAKFG